MTVEWYYADAETKARDFGKGRRCEGCGEPVSRYQSRYEGFIACYRCQDARARMDVKMHQFLRKRQRAGEGTGPGKRPGLVLPGLRPIRKSRGWSVAGLALEADCSSSYLQDVDGLRRGTTEERAAMLANVLGVSLEELRGDERVGVA